MKTLHETKHIKKRDSLSDGFIIEIDPADIKDRKHFAPKTTAHKNKKRYNRREFNNINRKNKNTCWEI